MAKELTNKQIAKMLNITCDFSELSFDVLGFVCDIKRYSWALESEANAVVEKMFGLDGRMGQGVEPETQTFSGLGKLINAQIKTNGLEWKVKETALGNGLSWYKIV